MKEHWISSEVIFSQENNILKIKYFLEIGVLQRSVLGQLLFFICINDFYFASKLKNVIIADNTNLSISEKI